MRLAPYTDYVQSQVPWLDHVPHGWTASRLDRLFQLRNEEPFESDPRVTAYLDGRVTNRSNVSGQKIKGVVKEAGWQRIHIGDFAISGMNAHLGGMGVSDSEGKCSPIYLVLEPKVGTNAHFVSLAVRHAASLGAIKALVQTIRFNSADMKRDDLKSIYVQIPPPEEQDTIVHFIRHIDHRVNKLIKAKRRLIELLNEQKQAIIHEVVTKGLDPTVPTKDSGVEWLGEIPEHWEVNRAKTVFKLRTEFSGTNHGLELLSIYTHIGVRPRKDLEQKGNRASTTDNYWIVKKGDLIVNKLLAWMGAVGVSDFEGVTSPAYDILKPIREVDSFYYHCLFRTTRYLQQFKKGSRGIMEMRLRLYFDQLGQIPIPIPPIREQREIVAEIKSSTFDIDLAISKTQSEIDLIREYRTRLVSDVVTGQLDVRALNIPEIEDQLEDLQTPDEDFEEELELEEALV